MRTLLPTVVVLLTLAACGTEPASAPESTERSALASATVSPGVDVTLLRLGGETPRVGANQFRLESPAGPVVIVSASTAMPAMGHGGPRPTLDPDDPAALEATFPMPGAWRLDCVVRVGEGAERPLELPLTVR